MTNERDQLRPHTSMAHRRRPCAQMRGKFNVAVLKESVNANEFNTAPDGVLPASPLAENGAIVLHPAVACLCAFGDRATSWPDARVGKWANWVCGKNGNLLRSPYQFIEFSLKAKGRNSGTIILYSCRLIQVTIPGRCRNSVAKSRDSSGTGALQVRRNRTAQAGQPATTRPRRSRRLGLDGRSFESDRQGEGVGDDWSSSLSHAEVGGRRR